MQIDELLIAASLLRWQEGELYHSAIVANLLEIGILLDDTCVLIIVEPIPTALLELCVELGIELVVIDNARIVDIFSINTDKATRTSGIRQRTQVVGSGNK